VVRALAVHSINEHGAELTQRSAIYFGKPGPSKEFACWSRKTRQPS
jgi:hypothetical protein